MADSRSTTAAAPDDIQITFSSARPPPLPRAPPAHSRNSSSHRSLDMLGSGGGGQTGQDRRLFPGKPGGRGDRQRDTPLQTAGITSIAQSPRGDGTTSANGGARQQNPRSMPSLPCKATTNDRSPWAGRTNGAGAHRTNTTQDSQDSRNGKARARRAGQGKGEKRGEEETAEDNEHRKGKADDKKEDKFCRGENQAQPEGSSRSNTSAAWAQARRGGSPDAGAPPQQPDVAKAVSVSNPDSGGQLADGSPVNNKRHELRKFQGEAPDGATHARELPASITQGQHGLRDDRAGATQPTIRNAGRARAAVDDRPKGDQRGRSSAALSSSSSSSSSPSPHTRHDVQQPSAKAPPSSSPALASQPLAGGGSIACLPAQMPQPHRGNTSASRSSARSALAAPQLHLAQQSRPTAQQQQSQQPQSAQGSSQLQLPPQLQLQLQQQLQQQPTAGHARQGAGAILGDFATTMAQQKPQQQPTAAPFSFAFRTNFQGGAHSLGQPQAQTRAPASTPQMLSGAIPPQGNAQSAFSAGFPWSTTSQAPLASAIPSQQQLQPHLQQQAQQQMQLQLQRLQQQQQQQQQQQERQQHNHHNHHQRQQQQHQALHQAGLSFPAGSHRSFASQLGPHQQLQQQKVQGPTLSQLPSQAHMPTQQMFPTSSQPHFQHQGQLASQAPAMPSQQPAMALLQQQLLMHQRQQQLQQQHQQLLLHQQQQSHLQPQAGFPSMFPTHAQAAHVPYMHDDKGEFLAKRARLDSNHSGNSAPNRHVEPCPVCGTKARKATKQFCTRCYSGLYNDIRKWIRDVSVLHDNPAAVSPERFAEDLKQIPRGCQHHYQCEKLFGSVNNCNRCRSIKLLLTWPDIFRQMLDKALDKGDHGSRSRHQ